VVQWTRWAPWLQKHLYYNDYNRSYPSFQFSFLYLGYMRSLSTPLTLGNRETVGMLYTCPRRRQHTDDHSHFRTISKNQHNYESYDVTIVDITFIGDNPRVTATGFSPLINAFCKELFFLAGLIGCKIVLKWLMSSSRKYECCYVVKNVSAVMLWKMWVLLCCREKCECCYVVVKNVSAVMLLRKHNITALIFSTTT
jgi:hypothetical protein